MDFSKITKNKSKNKKKILSRLLDNSLNNAINKPALPSKLKSLRLSKLFFFRKIKTRPKIVINKMFLKFNFTYPSKVS